MSLRTYDITPYRGPVVLTPCVTVDRAKTKKKKLSQCHPKRLQNEDTDHVWNELAFFKTEAKNLAVDK